LLKKARRTIERSFAHCYDTGGMRRVFLRGRENALKRQLIHVCAFNLSLIFGRLWVRGRRGNSATGSSGYSLDFVLQNCTCNELGAFCGRFATFKAPNRKDSTVPGPQLPSSDSQGYAKRTV